MDEADWLACADPEKMLEFLLDKASDRKLRLFACACCRMMSDGLPDDESRNALMTGERTADGLTNTIEQEAACRMLEELYGLVPCSDYVATYLACWPSPRTADQVARFLRHDLSGKGLQLCSLLRDFFGNPFCPSPPLPPAVLGWNDSTVPRLTQAIYEERHLPAGTLDTTRLAILADALLDAGCEDEELIRHCRSEGPHVRGCWAVDLILGKS